MTSPADSWKTPEIRAAEAQVDARLAEARELADRLKKEGVPPVGPPVDKERIAEQVKEAAGRPDAPAELRALKKKVDQGKFSWLDVVSGKVRDDPDVQKAQQANMAKLRQTFQLIKEGHSPQEILDAERGEYEGGDGDVMRDAW